MTSVAEVEKVMAESADLCITLETCAVGHLFEGDGRVELEGTGGQVSYVLWGFRIKFKY